MPYHFCQLPTKIQNNNLGALANWGNNIITETVIWFNTLSHVSVSNNIIITGFYVLVYIIKQGKKPHPYQHAIDKKKTRIPVTQIITLFSINLLVVYRESVNLIGYITCRLSADNLQLWIANENRLFWTHDACFTPQCTSRTVFETFELLM